MDEKIRGLLRQLGEAINETVMASPEIDAILRQLRTSGYDVYLMLEANMSVPLGASEEELKRELLESGFSDDDLKFLKRMKIQC